MIMICIQLKKLIWLFTGVLLGRMNSSPPHPPTTNNTDTTTTVTTTVTMHVCDAPHVHTVRCQARFMASYTCEARASAS